MNIELIQHPHKGLTQWDLGRRVRVPRCSEVHFAMQRDTQSLVVIPEVDDGKYTADVPNQLLVHSGVLLVWTVTNSISRHRTAFPVDKKPKPADYEYKTTDCADIIEMIENLEERVNALETTKTPEAIRAMIDERIGEYDAEINILGELILTGEDIDEDEIRDLIDGRLSEYKASVNSEGELILTGDE